MMNWGTMEPTRKIPVLRSIRSQPCRSGSRRKFSNPANFHPPVVKFVLFTYEKATRMVSKIGYPNMTSTQAITGKRKGHARILLRPAGRLDLRGRDMRRRHEVFSQSELPAISHRSQWTPGQPSTRRRGPLVLSSGLRAPGAVPY